MPTIVASKKKRPRNLSTLIVWLHERSTLVHLQWDNLTYPKYLYNLLFFFTIALQDFKLKNKLNEYKTGPYLRFVYSDSGNVIVKYIFVNNFFNSNIKSQKIK